MREKVIEFGEEAQLGPDTTALLTCQGAQVWSFYCSLKGLWARGEIRIVIFLSVFFIFLTVCLSVQVIVTIIKRGLLRRAKPEPDIFSFSPFFLLCLF